MTSAEDFRRAGKELVDFVADYMEGLAVGEGRDGSGGEELRVAPDVRPGFLLNSLPSAAPVRPETWEEVMEDVRSKVVPGTVHWSSPRFHAYYPAGNSLPSLLGDMLSGAMGKVAKGKRR